MKYDEKIKILTYFKAVNIELYFYKIYDGFQVFFFIILDQFSALFTQFYQIFTQI